MLQNLYFSAMGVAAISNFAGLMVNLFIAVINYKTWVQSHRSSSSDRILFSVGITRFLMLGVFILYVLCLFMAPNSERSAYVPTAFLLCWTFLDSNGLWFVTLLNVLYCVRITDFQHPVFLLLKRNLSPKLSRLLLACVLVSAVTTFLHVMLLQILPFPQFVIRRNGTIFDAHEGILSLAISLVLISFLRFLINVTSTSLLIHSLRRHIQKMQGNASGFWNPQTEAHVGALKLMVYFLLLYIPYAVVNLFNYLPYSMGMDLGFRSFGTIISTLYLVGHSLLIILTHPRLKTKAKKILCCNKLWHISSK
nr:PREDICTED: taste receptor type 2 member 4 [Rhinolophus sinicus]